jgi:hypothetical protein
MVKITVRIPVIFTINVLSNVKIDDFIDFGAATPPQNDINYFLAC